MRRLIGSILLLCVTFLAAPGCKRKKKRAEAAQEEPAGLGTMLHAADPRASVQFTKGFHEVEQGAWRWTEKNFAVTLRAPRNAVTAGATLILKLSVPQAIYSKVGAQTLSAKVGAVALQPETFQAAGDVTYTRDVPASAFSGESVNVEFSLDKALPPSDQDIRELGVIVSMAGFEARQ